MSSGKIFKTCIRDKGLPQKANKFLQIGDIKTSNRKICKVYKETIHKRENPNGLQS